MACVHIFGVQPQVRMDAFVEIQDANDTPAKVGSIHTSTAAVPTGSITDTHEDVASTVDVVTTVTTL